MGKRAVKDVLCGCRDTLSHVWIADCERVDLGLIAEAKSECQAPRYRNGGVVTDPASTDVVTFPSRSHLPSPLQQLFRGSSGDQIISI